MTELTKLETLEKAVVDTAADYAARVATADMLNAAVPYADGIESDAAYAAHCAADTAYVALSRARKELKDYLKEQDNE